MLGCACVYKERGDFSASCPAECLQWLQAVWMWKRTSRGIAAYTRLSLSSYRAVCSAGLAMMEWAKLRGQLRSRRSGVCYVEATALYTAAAIEQLYVTVPVFICCESLHGRGSPNLSQRERRRQSRIAMELRGASCAGCVAEAPYISDAQLCTSSRGCSAWLATHDDSLVPRCSSCIAESPLIGRRLS